MRGRQKKKHPASIIEFSVGLVIRKCFDSRVAKLVIDEAIQVKLYEVAVQKH